MLALLRSKFPFLVPRVANANGAESGGQLEEEQFIDLIEIDQLVDVTIEAAPPHAAIEINQPIDPAEAEQPVYVTEPEQPVDLVETHQHIGAVVTAPSIDLAETRQTINEAADAVYRSVRDVHIQLGIVK